MKLKYLLVFLLHSLANASPAFPPDIEKTLVPYKNWAGSVDIADPFLITYPQNASQVLDVVNWAYQNKRRARAQGYKHGFSPLVVTPQDPGNKTVVIDTTKYLNGISMHPSIQGIPAVEVEPGTTMENLLRFLEENSYGIVMAPEIGHDISIGGILAIGGHGAGIPAIDEKLSGNGYTFGSVSNLIAELDVVVWSNETESYIIKTFTRSDPEIGPYLVHVGRAIITRIVLFVGKNYNLRCISKLDISPEELFQNPETSTNLSNTLANLVDTYGRVDIHMFPDGDSAAVKLWQVAPVKPKTSRLVSKPYNFQFQMDFVTKQSFYKGLTKTNSWDIWGPSKNTILYSYFPPPKEPMVAAGFVILTNRNNIQLIANKFTSYYQQLTKSFTDKYGQHPVDFGLRVRVTGLDNRDDVGLTGAVETLLSPLTPSKEYPDFNAGIWINVIYSLNQNTSNLFMTDLESWTFSTFNNENAMARPEWSKIWGFTDNSAGFENSSYFESLPGRFGINSWNHAISIFDKYDPHKTISNNLINKLFTRG